jgi:Luciferase-like monooxygenase
VSVNDVVAGDLSRSNHNAPLLNSDNALKLQRPLVRDVHLGGSGGCGHRAAHPVRIAKEAVTVDHVSAGRFGLNIVAGWNEPEFDMFGIEQRHHDERYAVAG